MQGTQVQSLGRDNPREKGMATRQSSILAWKIPRKESLVGYSPWCHKELDRLSNFHFHFSHFLLASQVVQW